MGITRDKSTWAPSCMYPIIWVLPKHCKSGFFVKVDLDLLEISVRCLEKIQHILPNSGLMVMNPMVQSVQKHLKKQIKVCRDPLERNEWIVCSLLQHLGFAPA